MSALPLDPVALILLIPIGAAALLALLPGYRLTSQLSVLASLLTLLAALSLFVVEPDAPGSYLLIDDFNIVFIALNTFVGFTTSEEVRRYSSRKSRAGKTLGVCGESDKRLGVRPEARVSALGRCCR